ncbi:MAG: hypothetical protein Q7S34_01190 [bacterium]|nr:hypothetical protein [bacterium]
MPKGKGIIPFSTFPARPEDVQDIYFVERVNRPRIYATNGPSAHRDGRQAWRDAMSIVINSTPKFSKSTTAAKDRLVLELKEKFNMGPVLVTEGPAPYTMPEGYIRCVIYYQNVPDEMIKWFFTKFIDFDIGNFGATLEILHSVEVVG